MKLYVLNTAGLQETTLTDMSSMDAITRQLPEGYYSTFRTFAQGTRVLGLKAHLDRLYKPASAQNIQPAVDAVWFRKHLAALLHQYVNEAKLRVAIIPNGNFFITIEPLKPNPQTIYAQGVRVVTAAIHRNNPRLKSTKFVEASHTERKQVAREGKFEALLVSNGRILEGMTSNFFYVLDGSLGTARNNILLGVTRSTVLRLARKAGVRIMYRPLKLEQVGALSEAFITSSSRGVVPVIQIDETPVGEGIPGPITKQLLDAYSSYVLRHAEQIDVQAA